MTSIVDVRKAQKALDRAAANKNHAGRFSLRADMPFVESSMMNNVEYDESSNELDITFVGGKTYRYLKVPPDVYADLLDAESKGEFFNERIKDLYEFNEVSDRPRSW